MTKHVHQVVQHRSVLAGVEAMTLYSNHSFPRHSHDQHGIGIMTSGVQRSWSGVGHVEAVAGDVIMCNPGEMHDGMPAARTARGWRILYFEPSIVAAEIAGEPGQMIVPPVVRNRRLAAAVSTLFRRIERDVADTLAVEESLLTCLMLISQHHRLDRGRESRSSPSVMRAIALLDDAPARPVSLAELAALSGVSRFQLLRAFAREVGTTPHAYLIQRRVRLVRKYLAVGASPSEAASSAGFADQSHMTRAFVRHFGVTPARYQAAIA